MNHSRLVSRFLSRRLLPIALLLMACAGMAPAKEKLVLASTTSTLDSGFFEAFLPPFEKMYGCSVKVIAVGTGQAIRLGRDGNADVLLVHDREAEERFVAEGFGVRRFDVMHNDFFVVGPKEDPAGIRGLAALAAMKKLAAARAPFVSRGDDSGTHKKELRLWQAAGSAPGWSGYMESGTGMEATLRIANEKRAYCLVDRASWLSHVREIDALEILVEGDPALFNPYSVIAVAPAKWPHVNYKLATRFVQFCVSPEGQAIIRDYGKAKFGGPLYFPDAVR